MDVEVLVHLEPATNELAWWAESPEVPGFTSVAASLQELMDHCEHALTEIFSERQDALTSIQYRLVEDDSGNENPEPSSAPQAASGDVDEVRQVTRAPSVAA